MSIIPRLAHVGWLLALSVYMPTAPATAEIVVTDDIGKAVRLTSPARRIISLAPSVTELLFAAGAGDYVIGVVEYSDYPETAKRITRVGSGFGLNLEKIIGLRPDLIIGWQSGNPSWQLERIRMLAAAPLFTAEPVRIEDVASLLKRFGVLAGTATAADREAGRFLADYDRLRQRFADRATVSVFYQILDHSLLTVNHQHLINDIMHLCGGQNVFANRAGLTPRIEVENVLQANPEAIVASGFESLWRLWRERWSRWPTLHAATRNNFFYIPTDLMHRQGPRILQGAERLCIALESARLARGAR